MNWNNYSDEVLQGCLTGIMKIGAVIILLTSIICSLGGCKQIEYVPIETTHTIEHHHTDSVRQVDSIFKDKETIIMQLDSEEMAKYGIRLQAAEKAWLVKTAELEKQLQKLQHTKTDTLLKVDSIPYEVKTTVERKKTDYKGWFAFGGLLFLIVLYVVYRIRK